MEAFRLTGSNELAMLAKQLNYALTHLDQGNFIIEDWRTPALENSWVNYDNGVTYNTAGYYKDPFGIVHLKGLVATGTLYTTIFTLPEGYRPIKRHVREVNNYNGATYVHGRVDITATGAVTHVSGSNAQLSLDGLSFRAEQ